MTILLLCLSTNMKDMEEDIQLRNPVGDNNVQPEEPIYRRAPKPSLKNYQALFLLIQGILGTGILDAVLIFREGWLTGIVYTIFVGVLCTHCLHILIRSKNRLSARLGVPQLSYSQSMERALETGPPNLRRFSKMSHHMVDCCFIFCQLALCCVFSSLALGITPILNDYTKEWFKVDIAIPIWILISFILLYLAQCMRDLNVVANCCILGTGLLMGALGIVLWHICDEMPSIDDLIIITPPSFSHLTLVFGSVFFSLEAVTVISSFEGSLKSPKLFSKWWGTLNLGMLLVILLQCSIGFFGYFKFGNANLIYYFYFERYTTYKNGILLFALAMYISFGLQAYILVDILWKKSQRKRMSYKYFLRISLLVISVAVHVAKTIDVPYFQITMYHISRLIFGITVPVLGIIFPAVLDMCVNWPHDFKRGKFYRWKNLVLIIIGVITVFVSIVPPELLSR